MTNSFGRLHPSIQHHIVNTLGWSALRPLQAEAIDVVLADHHGLLLAPTAGGKTEAACFPVFSRMATEHWRPLSVLYLCPLRALLNNLEPRLSGYASYTGHRVALWHGDVGPGARDRILADPPDLLLTTPESLEAMLLSTRVPAREFFANLRTVVVDEVHEFGGHDRGWHLLAVLERLSRLAGRELQRIGLSATVGNPPELLQWLTSTCRRPASVLAPAAEATGGAAEVSADWVGSLANAARVVGQLHRGEKRLVFVDSRARAEELTATMRAGGVTTFLSHGSLSVDERRRTEQAFAEARNCVIVATSTLELGIDIGDLDRVVQIDGTLTVSSFLQRLGRTGRRPGAPRNTLFLATSEDALLDVLGVAGAWSSGFVERVRPPTLPAHLLAQQLMALVLQERGIGRNDWLGWLGSPHVFGPEVEALAETLCSSMLEGGILAADGPILGLGPRGEELFGARHFIELTSSFATLPLFTVRAGRSDVGVIPDIALVVAGKNDGLLLLAGRHWMIVSVDFKRRVVQVEPAAGGGKIRFWGGTGASSFELAQAIRSVLVGADPGVALSQRAKGKLDQIRANFAWLGPSGTPVVRDERGQATWWTFAGLRANLELAARAGALAGRLPDRLSMRVSVEATETALLAHAAAFPADEQVIDPPAWLVDDLKFAAALPDELAATVARRRLADPAAVQAIASLSRGA